MKEASADVESKDFDAEWGRTPLSYTAENGCLEVVEFLVNEGGADVESKVDDGNTVLDLARQEAAKGRS